MLRKFISVSIAFAVIFCCIVPTAFSAAAENVLYVSPDGSDTADGSFLSPLRSLEGAKNAAKSMAGHVTVYFRAGTYLFDNTVDFDENDKSDVTYKAYDGEKVVFTSGAAYSGFEKCTVNGHEAFKNMWVQTRTSVFFLMRIKCLSRDVFRRPVILRWNPSVMTIFS